MQEPRQIIVTGGRSFKDRTLIYQVLSEYDGQDPKPIMLHGACPTGADEIASTLAHDLGWTVVPYKPRYDLYPPHLAPLMRNKAMAYTGADLCLVFPGGTGTAHMADQARRAGITIRYVDRDSTSVTQPTLW